MRKATYKIDRQSVKAEMAKREWSQENLSHESGVAYVTISAALNGKTVLKDTVNKIANALGVEMESILEKIN